MMNSPSTMSKADAFTLASAIALVIGFFLPWISVFGLSASGWGLISLANSVNGMNPNAQGSAPAVLWLWLILIAGVCGLASSIWGLASPHSRRTASICSLVAGLAALTPFALLLMHGLGQTSQPSTSQPSMNLSVNVLSFIGVGVWATLLGAIGLVMQVFLPRPAIDTHRQPAVHDRPRLPNVSPPPPPAEIPAWMFQPLPDEEQPSNLGKAGIVHEIDLKAYLKRFGALPLPRKAGLNRRLRTVLYVVGIVALVVAAGGYYIGTGQHQSVGNGKVPAASSHFAVITPSDIPTALPTDTPLPIPTNTVASQDSLIASSLSASALSAGEPGHFHGQVLGTGVQIKGYPGSYVEFRLARSYDLLFGTIYNDDIQKVPGHLTVLDTTNSSSGKTLAEISFGAGQKKSLWIDVRGVGTLKIRLSENTTVDIIAQFRVNMGRSSATQSPSSSPSLAPTPFTNVSAASPTTTFFDDFSSYTPGLRPNGYLLRGATAITPTVEQVGEAGPVHRVLAFPEVPSQYWDKWVLRYGLLVSPPYTVTVKLNFQESVADRAGLTIAWNDANWNRIDIQPNVYGHDIEFRVTYSASDLSKVQVTGPATMGGLPIKAETNYWLRAAATSHGPGKGQVVVYWSTDGIRFTPVMMATGLANLIGLVGMSTAGPHLPNVYFDDFRVDYEDHCTVAGWCRGGDGGRRACHPPTEPARAQRCAQATLQASHDLPLRLARRS